MKKLIIPVALLLGILTSANSKTTNAVQSAANITDTIPPSMDTSSRMMNDTSKSRKSKNWNNGTNKKDKTSNKMKTDTTAY